MIRLIIIALTFFVSCSDPKSDFNAQLESEITNPVFLEMFNEYSKIIHDYHSIIDSDNIEDLSKIEGITKRASSWIDRWDEEIKKADLSLKEKLELIIEYDKLNEKYSR